ncbi:MAG: hypothetical protein MK222_03500, partial [Candidatus Poseidoniia archaeon]|nr:hypothetical protein [Candidatus Poseidoniia archaeon]
LTRLEHFSVGRLRILEVRLDDSSPAVGGTLDSVELPPHCRVVLVSRDGTEQASGSKRMLANAILDRVAS